MGKEAHCRKLEEIYNVGPIFNSTNNLNIFAMFSLSQE